MSKALRIAQGFSTLLIYLCGGIIILMMLHVVADIISKFFFDFPLDGTTAIVAHYYMVAIIYLPLAYIQSKNEHIVSGLFTDRLSETKKKYLNIFVNLISAGFLALLVWRTGIQAMRSTQSGDFIQTASYYLPTWDTRWLLPIGLGAMSIYMILDALLQLSSVFHLIKNKVTSHKKRAAN